MAALIFWKKKGEKKISLLFLSYGKAVNGPYHTEMPPPPQQPTSTQSLIPPSSKQYAPVCCENITNDQKEIISRPVAHAILQATPEALLLSPCGYITGRTVSACICFLHFELQRPSIQLGYVTSDFNNPVNLDLFSAEERRRRDLYHSVCRCVWISRLLHPFYLPVTHERVSTRRCE